jgi:hypothetical protein
VRELDRAGQELYVERLGMRMECGTQDEITAGWAALDEVRARLARQNRRADRVHESVSAGRHRG